jgi:NTE family protein
MNRPETPKTAHEIMNRINEISFNSSLLKELRAIAFVKKLIEHDMLKEEHRDSFKDVLVHSIRDDKLMCELSLASKFTSDWDFLLMLRDKGRASMEQWLHDNFDAIGVRDTVDLNSEFLSSNTKIFDDISKRRDRKLGPKTKIVDRDF